MSQSPRDESPDEDSVVPLIIISLTEDRGQIQLCHNLIANIFEQGTNPCKAKFPEIKIKRQIVDHYIKGICKLTQQKGIYTIKLSTASKLHGKYVIQTDDVDIEFSKISQNTLKTCNIKIHRKQTQFSLTRFLQKNIINYLY